MRSIFRRAFKYLQIKDWGPNLWGESVLQKVWIVWSTLVYFNSKSFLDPNSSSFLRFQCILHDSGVLFSKSRNFYKLKRGGSNFWGEQILQKVWIIWSPLLYCKFKSFTDPNSSSFIRFQCIVHNSGVFAQHFNKPTRCCCVMIML